VRKNAVGCNHRPDFSAHERLGRYKNTLRKSLSAQVAILQMTYRQVDGRETEANVFVESEDVRRNGTGYSLNRRKNYRRWLSLGNL